MRHGSRPTSRGSRPPTAWRPLLANVDAVVNCVGVLQDGARDNVQAVQVEGTCALFDACVRAGVRRVVHVSAIGASTRARPRSRAPRRRPTRIWRALDLDWVILRPAWCWRRRPMAAARCCAVSPGCRGSRPSVASQVQIVSSRRCRRYGRVLPARRCAGASDLGESDLGADASATHDLGDVVAALRAWHGFPPRPRLRVPRGRVRRGRDVCGARRAARLAQPGARDRTGAALRRRGRRSVGMDRARPASSRRASTRSSRSARRACRTAGSRGSTGSSRSRSLRLPLFWIMTGVIALGPGRATGDGVPDPGRVRAAAAEFAARARIAVRHRGRARPAGAAFHPARAAS